MNRVDKRFTFYSQMALFHPAFIIITLLWYRYLLLTAKKCIVRRSLSKTLDGTFKLHFFCVFVFSSGFQSHCVSLKLDLGENLPTFWMFIHHNWRGSFRKVTAQVITASPERLQKPWLDLQIKFVTDELPIIKMPGYISKITTKTRKEKRRYGERFLYFSPWCDTCLFNSALDEQKNYFSSIRRFVRTFKSINRKFLAVLQALFADDAVESGGRWIHSRVDVQNWAFLELYFTKFETLWDDLSLC